MENCEDKRVPKTKEDKDAAKALKKLEKGKRKEKSLNKPDNNNTSSSSNAGNSVPTKIINSDVKKEKSNNVSIKETIKSQTIDKNSEQSTVPKKVTKEKVELRKRVWFKNLYQPYRCDNFIEKISVNENIHPEFIKFGTQIYNDEIHDSTQKCRLLLGATLALLSEFNVDSGENLPRLFGAKFDSHVDFINRCRPLAATMRTAVRYIKSNLMRMNESDNAKCKKQISEMVEQFQSERIDAAQKTIVASMSRHIKTGDRILVYEYSELVFQSILYASTQMKSLCAITVFVVDSFPGNEAQQMVDQLKSHNIAFCRTQLAAVPSIIKQVDLVILAAHAILPDNTVLACAGSASIAHTARLHQRPVVVCAETCRFSVHHGNEDYDGDSSGGHELVDPAPMVVAMTTHDPALSPLVSSWRQPQSLVTPLDVAYDTLSHRLVSMVCSELGTLAPTSASFVTHLKQPVDV